MRLSVTALAIAFAGGVVLAQAPQGAQSAPPAAPKAGPMPPARAHAVIKGEGITGTADFVEHDMGAGRVVDVTVSVAGMKPGQHVLLLRPIVGGTSGWTAPWTSLVRQRAADWARALLHDRRFKLTHRLPHLRTDYTPRGLRALIFTRVNAG